MKTLSQTLLALGLIVFSVSAQAQSISSKKVSTNNKIKDGRKSVVSKINTKNDSAVVIKPQVVPLKGFRISGNIKGINNGVIHMMSKNGTLGDSALITDGKFTLNGNIKEPDGRGFVITPGNWGFRAFIENTNISLFIDTAYAQHQYGRGKDYPIIWLIEEHGSEFANFFTRYFNETGQSAGMSIMKQLKTTTDIQARQVLVAKMDSISGQVEAKQKTWIENYILQNPSSLAGVFIFSEVYNTTLYDTPPDYLRSILKQFYGPATTSSYYKELSDRLINFKNIQANTIAPDFKLLKRDKTKFAISSKRGKIVLIDFWASWCVPCRKAIPGWKALYAKYKSKGFDMVSVSEDDDSKNWYAALDKEKMPWTQVIDFSYKEPKANVLNLFPSRYIPLYVLLDKEGKVIITGNDDVVIAKKIAEILD